MDQFLSLTSIVDNQSVQRRRASNLELGLSEWLTGLVQFFVNLNSGGLNVSSSGQFQKLFDVGDFSSHFSLIFCRTIFNLK